MDNSLIEQGFNLMLFGMGTVFIFLTILIFATAGMSKTILRWFPEKIIEPPTPKKRATAASGASIAPATLKILQAAIDQHRKGK
ncbi:hypothetical protein GCM10009133_20170 [Cocleimonas flava]|jgi:oxaloacetate decarboxylase gamma subunit|uniref:Probable oxaloacetate decarboxylase gamma chain n=1 Tax=Cocleimonas flava TaxID=634765 RepID=A0A4R1EW05_9GAMM|nr:MULTISPECIES: OadG family protein [Cocleimonas]MEB8433741.1 OadG family protein [Cocleimonas sp. KMM 6892]MEC4716552.1 OadG family protein [Cocleimonas sp. KMM 6895]MEC4746293.1 OadG family protein [Cocleimonas sp. KMM 6896]TCJ84940.1 oxaloacetate decarboxylase gamma subunit [Cocleimonas flava]